jgi:hypothetical protein
MDFARLKEVLSAFADDPSALHFEKGNIMVQIQSEVISAKVTPGEFGLMIEETGLAPQPVGKWLTGRIAHLDQLAHSISQTTSPCKDFITSPAHLLDQLEFASSDELVKVHDALATTMATLARRTPGMCSVLYVTSDAGEGKTTLINQMALSQAKLYTERRADWLIVPISLGGNPFLRLDNVIAAALLNQLRFRRLYFEGFMQLVRLGYIVLALDGFEEVFVETAGDAVSSLGNLISDLKGEGTLLVAARTAYFDFRRLDQQARLIDAIPGFDVGFAKVSLDRWGVTEFVSLCELNGVPEGASLYEELRTKLGTNHPLLTRAVFVQRMVDLAKADQGLAFITQTEDVNDLFHPFIDTILRREIESKWIDKLSEVAGPLLSLEEHYGLLELISEEMWLSKRSSLPLDTCDSLAELFCDTGKKSPSISRQVRDRLSHHALLVSDSTRAQISFDHDHFRDFFLGELLGAYLMTGSQADLRKLLRVDALQNFALDITVSFCVTRHAEIEKVVKTILEVASTEGPSSFLRQNSGALVIRLVSRASETGPTIQVEDLSFPVDALANRRVVRTKFRRCYFQETELSSEISNVEFEGCDFEDLQLASHARIDGVRFIDSEIRALTFFKNGSSGTDYFDPKLIASLLLAHGAEISRNSQIVISSVVLADDDKETSCIRKLLSIFTRSLETSENVLNLKLGVNAGWFFSDFLAELIKINILEEVPHRGRREQRRFRLGMAVGDIATALAKANGSFKSLRQILKEN